MNIGITGGSGFIGTALTKKIVSAGHSVTVYDRTPPRLLTDESLTQAERNLITFIETDFLLGALPASITYHEALIHLAGVSIYNRWTPEYQNQIMQSRVQSTNAIIAACEASPVRPQVFVCASAVGYYGDQGDRILDESAAPASGSDFLGGVCVAWESAAAGIERLGIRRVSMRTAIVLGPGGGMMSQIVPLFTWGLGGRLGSGNQWFSWIHIDDLVAIYYEAIMNPELSGPVNATAPEPVTNRTFTAALARSLHRYAPWRIPRWVLMVVLGEFARAVLASTRAIPQKLLDAHFVFRYPTIDQALGGDVDRHRTGML